MSEEPDLTLVEADIRNVATIMELTQELRRIRESLGEIIVQLDRIPPMERLVREIAQGLGVPL